MSIWQDLWASFKAVLGPLLGALTLVLAVLGPLYLPAAVVRVSVVWIVVAVLVMATAVLTAWDMVARARRQARDRLPRVRAAFTVGAAEAGTAAQVTLLLDPSALFGFDLMVSIYYNDLVNPDRGEAFERLIGMGRVSNIQENGLIQVLVWREARAEEDLWQRIRRREGAVVARVVVKPSVPWSQVRVEGL